MKKYQSLIDGKTSILKKGTIEASIAIIFAILMECTLFNYRFWESFFFPDPTVPTVSVGDGVCNIGDNRFKVTSENVDDVYIELPDIRYEVKNLYLNAIRDETSRLPGEALIICVSKKDDADGEYRALPAITCVSEVTSSRYIRLYLSGRCYGLRIHFAMNKGSIFQIRGLGLNKKVPFNFSSVRFFTISFIMSLLIWFRPGSIVYKRVISLKDRWQVILFIIYFSLQILLSVLIILSTSPQIWNEYMPHNEREYEYLGDALYHGHVSFYQWQPPEWLIAMSDPYDTTIREARMLETGEGYEWDVAFFGGKYYCYFGVIPAVIFFLPYQVITGKMLSTWVAMIICTCIYYTGVYFFIWRLSKKYLGDISIGIYLLICSAFGVSCGGCLLPQRSSVYNLAILSALMFTVWGIACWLSAVGEEGQIKNRYLILGSICEALVVGCRPQVAVGALLFLPIFMKQMKAGFFRGKRGVNNLLSIVLPYGAILSALLFYNYVRFRNIFDFGALYNLTIFNMPQNVKSIYKAICGLFSFYLQPMNISTKYPFINIINGTEYQGYILFEDMIGGFFSVNPIGVTGLTILKRKNQLREYRSFGTMALLLGFVISLVDVLMVGVLSRYMFDFAWLFMIVAVLVIMETSKSNKDSILKICIFLTMLCVVTNYLSIIPDFSQRSLLRFNPLLFYQIKYMFFHI